MRAKRLTGVALAAVLAFAAIDTADAGTISVDRDEYGADAYSGHSGGGEFKVTSFSGASVAAMGSGAGLTGGLFQTFCLQLRSPISTSATYQWDLGTATAPEGDPLDARTAYLYTQFYNGTLSNYEYADLGTSATERGRHANWLQHTIWYIEGEISTWTWNHVASAQSKAWLSEADAAVAGSWGNTIGNVRILQLYQLGGSSSGGDDDNHHHHHGCRTGTRRIEAQDLLVMTPTVVPLPPAAWMGLALLAGMAALVRVRTRRTPTF